LVWYAGPTLARDGAYDELLDGRLPACAPCRLSIELISTAPAWRSWTRRPLLGVGGFDGPAGRLEMTVVSVAE
jgi:hypothetical protein